jgi:tRNA(fMet)-specific endonuclease VapC
VRGYFLDTCVLSDWYNKDDRILDRICNLGTDPPLWVSVIAWGEVEYGIQSQAPTERQDLDEFRQFVKEIGGPKEISKHTGPCYGKLRALLFEEFAPKGKRNKSLRPEQLVDPVTSKELGIQENDLWMAAQAMEHNFILATGDKMNRISKIAQGLVTIENWLE